MLCCVSVSSLHLASLGASQTAALRSLLCCAVSTRLPVASGAAQNCYSTTHVCCAVPCRAILCTPSLLALLRVCPWPCQARLAAYQEALSELVMFKSKIDVAVLQVGCGH